MNIIPWIQQKFTYKDGRPLAYGKVYAYISGSDTPANTYKDFQGNADNENPIILGADGSAQIYGDPTITYRFEVFDRNENPIDEKDGVIIPSSAGASDSGKVKVSGTDTVAGYLGTKLTEGSNVALTVTNDILGDTLEVSATDSKVQAEAGDTTNGYLREKLQSDDGSIVVTVVNEVVDLAIDPNLTADKTLSDIAGASGDTAKSTYKMTSSVPVTFERYNNSSPFFTINQDAGKVIADSDIDATGDVTANAFIGDGSQLTNLPSEVAGSDTWLQFNDGGTTFGANSNLAYDGTLKVNGSSTYAMEVTGGSVRGIYTEKGIDSRGGLLLSIENSDTPLNIQNNTGGQISTGIDMFGDYITGIDLDITGNGEAINANTSGGFYSIQAFGGSLGSIYAENGITLGNNNTSTANGTLRYTGSDAEVLKGGVWTSITTGGGGGTSQAGVSSYPWALSGATLSHNLTSSQGFYLSVLVIPEQDVEVNEMSFWVTASGTNHSTRLGIYSHGSSDTLLRETVNLSTTTLNKGLNTIALTSAITLTKNTMYMFAIQSSSNAMGIMLRSGGYNPNSPDHLSRYDSQNAGNPSSGMQSSVNYSTTNRKVLISATY